MYYLRIPPNLMMAHEDTKEIWRAIGRVSEMVEELREAHEMAVNFKDLTASAASKARKAYSSAKSAASAAKDFMLGVNWTKWTNDPKYKDMPIPELEGGKTITVLKLELDTTNERIKAAKKELSNQEGLLSKVLANAGTAEKYLKRLEDLEQKKLAFDQASANVGATPASK